MSVSPSRVPEVATAAWTRLRDGLVTILGEDLVAIWAYGGTIATDGGPTRSADLDTYVLVRRPLDDATAQAIREVEAAVAADAGVAWDNWYVVEGDAREAEPPRHALRRDPNASWAIDRAHWLAGRYVLVYGVAPEDIVPAPSRHELEIDLDRELEHLERHVVEGHDDPDEATYAFLNGSRILRALADGDVAISKRAAGAWALDRVPDRWHAALRAACRAYDGQAAPGDAALLAHQMAPFVAMVRERLPAVARRPDEGPRWS